MKKSVLFGLTALLTLFVSVPAFGAVANPTPAKVLVNADEIELQALNCATILPMILFICIKGLFSTMVPPSKNPLITR